MMYQVLAYYKFVTLEDPALEVKKHINFLKDKDAGCRIYISEDGINGQLSASEADSIAYQAWLKQDTRFQDISFKIHTHHENVFPKVCVKYRPQLVALDRPIDMNKTATHVTPSEWKKMLESEEPKLLLDIRNDYEVALGHFKGTYPDLNVNTFRQFPEQVQRLKEKYSLDTPVWTCCTGGIRCELFTVLLKEEGFKNVYQLDGGIIGYGLEHGDTHWEGKLFVFDDRLSVSLGDTAACITRCHHCQLQADLYYNCAHMDCNALFICCPSCLEHKKGCCSDSCMQAVRVRPYARAGNKPFRKMDAHSKQALVQKACHELGELQP